jgi:hypothetical protein
MPKPPGKDESQKPVLKTAPKPFAPKKDKPKLPKPPKQRIQRHQGR